ncbi:MAG TPA: hypothetical protein PLB79_01845, partial [Thermotogota bacterium]|nr:hypothetical protein [Thermotogota bacterium]
IPRPAPTPQAPPPWLGGRAIRNAFPSTPRPGATRKALPAMSRPRWRHEMKVSAPKLVAWMEWMSQMGEKEWTVYHPTLSLDRLVSGLETLWTVEKSQ